MNLPTDVGHLEKSGEFTSEQWQRVDAVIDKYRGKPGALIPVLEDVQEVCGYLPEAIQRYISKQTGIPLSQVYGVVTFYSFFTMVPRGAHQIRICLGTSCHVKGGQKLVGAVEDKLQIGEGECTEDRKFSLDIVRCIGACGLAPVMMIDKKVHRQVKVAKINQLLNACD